ncbi:hypothetical protein [Salinithrix halophila]|uniref:DUF4406 domain-containing protein n=1 Tax=Salinithrix halophila TaxID=1485204 RepID=A0ABV8JCJ3_9BACL
MNPIPQSPQRPTIITLCGSTRFKRQFEEANASLSLQGYIVLSVGFFEQADDLALTGKQANQLTDLHFRKIDLSDELFIIDVDGYIGESTQREIQYARALEKPIRFYSKEGLPPSPLSLKG